MSFVSSPGLVTALLVPCVVAAAVYYLATVVLWLRRVRRAGKSIDNLPGTNGHWLFGHILEHPGANEAGMLYLVDYAKRHGNKGPIKFWFGPFRPSAHFVHPDSMKAIMKTNEPKALSGNGLYNFVRPWLGDGLLISNGAKWLRNRKLMTPAFHFDILRPYMDVYNEAAEVLLNKWETQCQRYPEEGLEICSDISLCTLDIILRCAFSYTDNVQQTGKNNPYINSVVSLSQMIAQRSFKILWYVDWLYYHTSHGKNFAKTCDYVHTVAETIITKRQKTLKENAVEVKSRHRDFLDILLLARDERGVGLTDVEIRHEVDTFLFEGHDTTSSAISWCLYHLAKYPEIQQKVYCEVDAIVGSRDSVIITWDDLNEMSYLTMCIKESMRCRPPVTFIARELTAPMEISGTTLLPGQIIIINIFALHHNESVWGPDHMEYIPERFDTENIKKMDSHAFLPFSAGSRNCIGQAFAMHEIKVLLARIVHRYILELDPRHTVEMLPELVLHAKTGIQLLLTRR